MSTTTTATPTTRKRYAIDTAEVERAIRLLIPAGEVVEVRSPKAISAQDRRPHVIDGFFDSAETLARGLAYITEAEGIYFTLNAFDPAHLALAHNRLLDRPASTIADAHITRRRWLPIDLDPERPVKTVSATDAEHTLALDRARRIAAALQAEGWPAPIQIDSGNGAWLLWAIDLPANDGGLVQNCLQALASRFDDALVKVDTSVYNPARIGKIPGTWARKGDDTPERPHRQARLLAVPDQVQVVPEARLRTLAATRPQEPARPQRGARRTEPASDFDLEKWIGEHLPGAKGPRNWTTQEGKGQKWVLDCPWNPDHTGSAWVGELGNGAITAGCQHQSCTWTWDNLRAKFEPGHRERVADRRNGGSGHQPRTTDPAQHLPTPSTPRAVTADYTGPAIWRNRDHDQPVEISGCAGPGPDGATYMSIAGSSTAIPLAELHLPAISADQIAATDELPGYLEDGAEEVLTTPSTRPAAKQAPAARPVAEIIAELEALRPEDGGKPERTAVDHTAADLVSDCALLKEGDRLKVEATLRDLGLPQELVRNWRSDVLKVIKSQPTAEDEGSHETQAQALLRIASAAQYFRTPGGDLYARFESQGHRETHPLRERGSTFRHWLLSAYMRQAGSPPSPTAMSSVLDALEARAYYGPEIPVFTRIAKHDEAIYLDIADAQWRAIKITAAGWEVVSQPPVAFRRAKGMLALPLPKRNAGRLSELLRPFLNLSDDDKSLKLILGWLVGALSPDGPYAQLALYGEQGTAKSTVTRLLRAIIDPNEAMARSAPREDRDLAIAAKNSWIVAFDNLSSLPDWLSDALCRLSTGAASSTRALYTDDDEALFSAKRPVIVNGIEEIVSRGDLLDRLIVVNLPVIPKSKRKTERKFWAAFDEAHPALLGALLDVAAVALSRLGTIQVADLPRLADFALWVEAAAPALDWQPGDFLAVFDTNQAESTQTEIEASPLAQLFLKLCQEKVTAQHNTWSTTATELLDLLKERLPDDHKQQKPKWFPGAPHHLSGKLRRLAPALRTLGWTIDCDAHDSSGKRRRITIERGQISVDPTENGAGSPVASDANSMVSDATPTLTTEVSVGTHIMKEAKQLTLETPDPTLPTLKNAIPIFSSVARGVSEEKESARAKEGSARASEKLESRANSVGSVGSVGSLTADDDVEVF